MKLSTRNKSYKYIVTVACIFTLALALRLWGIRFGLPYTYHYDEPYYVGNALKLGTGVIGEIWSPFAFLNILFVEFAAFFLTGRLAGLFHSAAEFEQFYRNDPTYFYLIGRITTAFLGAATALLCCQLGNKFFNRKIGLISGIFLAVSFLHVRDSHFAVPDITATFLVVLTMLLIINSLQKKSLLILTLASVAAGLAVSTKWTVWPIVISIELEVFYLARIRNERNWITGLLGLSLLTGAVFLISFLIAGFQFVIVPNEVMKYIMTEFKYGQSHGFGVWIVDTLPGWLFYLKTLLIGIGWPMLLSAIAGLGWLFFELLNHRKKEYAILLSFPVIYYGYMGSTSHYFARYSLLLIPFISIFAAYLTVRLTDILMKWNQGIAKLTLAGLMTLILLQPFIYSIRFDYLMTQVDTRTIAKNWIEENLPDEAKIATDLDIYSPPLSTKENPVPQSTRNYQVIQPGFYGLFKGQASDYRNLGVDYLITSSFLDEVTLVNAERQNSRTKFYHDIDNEYTLIKSFYPGQVGQDPTFIFDEIYGPIASLWQRDRPGPVIKIYKVTPAGKS
jgi:hypothetical protein